MTHKKQISIEKRSAICTLRNEGYSMSQIAQKVGVSKKGVYTTLDRSQKFGSLMDRKRSGRPRKTTKAEDKYIIMKSKRNRRLTAVDITNDFNFGKSSKISITTVKTRLLRAGLRGRVAIKKPLLRIVNKKKRLEWAKKHANWTAEQWNSVLWTDESKFEIFGSKRRVYVRRFPGEQMNDDCVVSTIKHGNGNVMVWGCFAGNRVGTLKKIDGILRKEGYLSILRDTAIPCGRQLCGRNFVFQEDNDPKHSSALCRNYLQGLERKNVCKRMIWPAQSPDLSPIEFLWDELDRQVRKTAATNEKNFWLRLQQAWVNIPHETLQKLVNRMPRICQAVIKAKGGHFDENAV